ncbi:MAG: hypothetical protein U9P82_00175 [Bacteroidota bacterium]|nr:hypothetical protein [Bacteroidota bacterium]
MRILNKFEKYLVTQMCQVDWHGNLNIPNLLDNYLQGLRIQIKREQNTVELLFETQTVQPDENETTALIDKIGGINQIIISTVNLISLLEKEGYIVLFNSATQIDNEVTFGQGAVNLPFVTYTFPDEKTKNLLIDYTTKQIIPSTELDEYKKNKFLTRDDLKFRKNIRMAWIAILISIVSTISGLYFSVHNTYFKKPSEVYKPYIENIKKELKTNGEFINKLIAVLNIFKIKNI